MNPLVPFWRDPARVETNENRRLHSAVSAHQPGEELIDVNTHQ